MAGNNSTGDDESSSQNIKVGDADVQGVEESISDFFNNSRSKLLAALVNLSSYLPLNVEYAMTDGQKCDIIRYNRPFYNNIPLILAAVLIALGTLFTFFGEHFSSLVFVIYLGGEVGTATDTCAFDSKSNVFTVVKYSQIKKVCGISLRLIQVHFL